MAFDIEVDLSRLNEIEKLITSAFMDDAIPKIGAIFNKDLIDASPYKTGHLAGSWSIEQKGTQIYAKNTASYASYVINGTSPHDIRAKSNVLAFEMNGSTIFAKHVHHPGTRPNNFIDTAIDNVQNEIETIISESLNRAGVE